MKAPRKNSLPWKIALGVYLVGPALVGYWPTPVDKPIYGTLAAVLRYLHGHGVPTWFNYNVIEAGANVALFIPLGFLASMALYSRATWQLLSIGLLISALWRSDSSCSLMPAFQVSLMCHKQPWNGHRRDDGPW